MTFPTIDPVATGERIRELRQEQKIKVTDISRFLGFESTQAVYKWQRGESLPTVDNLYALSRFLGVTVDEILCGRDGIEADDKSASFILYYRFTNCALLNCIMGAEIMNKILFDEFKMVSYELQTGNEKYDVDKLVEQTRMLFDISSNIHRGAGLLWLDEIIQQMKNTGTEGFLKRLFELITDGMPSDDLVNIALLRYYKKKRNAEEQLLYLMYIIACVNIQDGMLPRFLEEYLLALLSKEAEDKYVTLYGDIMHIEYKVLL